MPSTVQIIRELKILMRHDAEQAGPALVPGAASAGAVDRGEAALLSPGALSLSDVP